MGGGGLFTAQLGPVPALHMRVQGVRQRMGTTPHAHERRGAAGLEKAAEEKERDGKQPHLARVFPQRRKRRLQVLPNLVARLRGGRELRNSASQAPAAMLQNKQPLASCVPAAFAGSRQTARRKGRPKCKGMPTAS